MNIKVDKYRIKSDGLNVWIEREIKPRSELTKEISTENISGFHSTFYSALRSLATHHLLERDCQDLHSALESLSDIESKLNLIVSGLRSELETLKSSGDDLGIKIL